MEKNLFLIATKSKFRFPSIKGELLAEQLWDLPLTAANGFSLDAIAQSVNAGLEALGAKSFVETANTAEKTQLSDMLEVVKFVIADKQAANKADLDRREKRARRAKLIDALEKREDADLASKSREDILKELEDLD
jgi:hypothetical protein